MLSATFERDESEFRRPGKVTPGASPGMSMMLKRVLAASSDVAAVRLAGSSDAAKAEC
jgi:hypothetical protein